MMRKKRYWEKMVSILCVSVLGSFCFSNMEPADSILYSMPDAVGFSIGYNVAQAKKNTVKNPRIDKWGCATYGKITFGSYYQNRSKAVKAPVKWRILKINGDDAFVLADQALDARAYHNRSGKVTWEKCSLRKWLNHDFYNKAFTKEEKAAIKKSKVINTEGGNDTKDRIYLPSLQEISDASYGFDGDVWESRKPLAKATDYAAEKKYLQRTTAGVKPTRCCEWWLRSPGEKKDMASYIDSWPYTDYEDENTTKYGDTCRAKKGIRPVLHVNLKSSAVISAGSLDSEGNIYDSDHEYENPVVKDGVTTWDCIYFGNYYQTLVFEKEPIEWRVLSVDKNDAFLVSEQILDVKPYHEKAEDITWENCTLRRWLQNDFFLTAFSPEEQEAIQIMNNRNEGVSSEAFKEGKATSDKIFLLSYQDASNPVYWFESQFYNGSIARRALPTDYARIHGDGNKACPYWLRQTGSGIAAVIEDSLGSFDDVDSRNVGVRPALHLNLKKASYQSAGTVYEVALRKGLDKVKKVTKLSLRNKGKRRIIVYWKLQDADGYQIWYSQNKKFKKKVGRIDNYHCYRESGTEGIAYEPIEKLKKGKAYYVKVRAYNRVYNRKKARYGKWSTVKKIRVRS